MNVDKLYAVITVSDLARSRDFYAKLFGRAPDTSPMPGLHEWHMPAEAGVQLLEDADRAGKAMLTLVVDQLDMVRALLADRGLTLGEGIAGAVATIALIDDPDGNRITFAQPARVPTR